MMLSALSAILTCQQLLMQIVDEGAGRIARAAALVHIQQLVRFRAMTVLQCRYEPTDGGNACSVAGFAWQHLPRGSSTDNSRQDAVQGSSLRSSKAPGHRA